MHSKLLISIVLYFLKIIEKNKSFPYQVHQPSHCSCGLFNALQAAVVHSNSQLASSGERNYSLDSTEPKIFFIVEEDASFFLGIVYVAMQSVSKNPDEF